ncbi:hypothetical protein SAMN04488073_3250 [Marinobacter gudaonensis]|uniref:Uncharacterized protein n=1 Tax=Marinobacter gudaonensis TaxID=375760 RepID=A0A1I6HZV3_9GAMM|nr:hypothetical protein [Marinobacter gudaonensis]SFR59992.1 hypothetical protein SAMN04488073_3250 [Marinobacter gudaonensis]
MNHDRFSSFLSQHDLPPSFVYLAPILPVVQVMWADGRNQMPERAKLHCIIESHCTALSDLAGGVEIVSANDIELFDRTFIANRPDPRVLEMFVGLASEVVAHRELAFNQPDNQTNESLFRPEQLFHACMEIAATCPACKDKSLGGLFALRVAKQERSLIEKTFELFQTNLQSISGIKQ